MTLLRQKMIRDMQLRRLAPKTQEAYLRAVYGLAQHYNQSPDQIKEAQIQDYIVGLLNRRKLSWSTCDQIASGLEFFYQNTLGKTQSHFSLPRRKHAQKLPEILSPMELEKLFSCASNPKYRMLLMLTYSGGLRLSEVIQLKVSDIDSQRMMIRVHQGKGCKDRYTVLSKRLLEELRSYWKLFRPSHWLFPGQRGSRPINPTCAQKAFTATKRLAGIKKQGGIHMLRHAFATHLLESNVDVRTIQKLMGHKYMETTARYMQVTQQRLEATPNPLDRLRVSVLPAI